MCQQRRPRIILLGGFVAASPHVPSLTASSCWLLVATAGDGLVVAVVSGGLPEAAAGGRPLPAVLFGMQPATAVGDTLLLVAGGGLWLTPSRTGLLETVWLRCC